MGNIHEMKKIEEVLAINPDRIDRIMDARELLRIAKITEAAWYYDYVARDEGLFGNHAIYSGLHTDFLLRSGRHMLRHKNICQLMAKQLAFLFSHLGIPDPDWIIGFPENKTELAVKLAEILGVKPTFLDRRNGQIGFENRVLKTDSVIWVKDFFTNDAKIKQVYSDFFNKISVSDKSSVILTLINQGEHNSIDIGSGNKINIVSLVRVRPNYWPEKECPLCPQSPALNPNDNPLVWHLLFGSQKR